MLIVIYIFEGTVDSVCSASHSLVLVAVYNLVWAGVFNLYCLNWSSSACLMYTIQFGLVRIVRTDLCYKFLAGVCFILTMYTYTLIWPGMI